MTWRATLVAVLLMVAAAVGLFWVFQRQIGAVKAKGGDAEALIAEVGTLKDIIAAGRATKNVVIYWNKG